MNKTIIINISGVIFHIEEDAYELLKSYMDDIKRHFDNYKDSFEIVSDIESRVAEMLSELLITDSKQVIVLADVQNVTQRMGKPSDFETAEDEDYGFASANGKKLSKKLFRDTDDRFVAGVCSGIAHYFDVEPKWARVAFVVLFMLYGFGLLTYLLLWIVIPKAKTRTDKMEMKGERINLQTFQKNIEEEINAVASKIRTASANTPAIDKLGIFLREIIESVFKYLGSMGKLILKVIGICSMIFIGLLLTGAFIFLMVYLGYAGNTDIGTIFPLNIVNEEMRSVLFICVFLIVVIPLTALIFLLLRAVFNSKNIPSSINFSLLMIWIVALATAIFCVAKNATEFKEEASFSETTTLKTNPSQIYVIRLADERTFREEISGNGGSSKLIKISGSDRDFDTPNEFDLELQVSEGDRPVLAKTYAARGSNFEEALRNANQIDYYYQQQDSVLTFDYRFDLKGASLWRSQEVKIKLQIPIDSKLLIEKRMADRLFWHQLRKCIDYDANDDTLITLTATKNGFVCNKTPKAIEEERSYNKENEIDEEVNETVVF